MKEVIHLKSRLIQETVPYTGAMEMLECSRCKICELCKSGELVSIIHAGKRRIYIDSIDCLLYTSRVRDLNPGDAHHAYTISNRAPSRCV